MITFYDNKGKIVLSAVCADDAVQALIDNPDFSNYSYLRAEYNPQEFYIDINTAQPVPIPEKPGPDYYFSYNTYSWELRLDVAETRAINLRNTLLANSDWTDTLSSKNRLGEDLYNQWQAYRQALRDVPEQAGFPLAIVWPTPPE
jgi:hypothetical protein